MNLSDSLFTFKSYFIIWLTEKHLIIQSSALLAFHCIRLIYPQGLRQTATFSIQEILEHFRLTVYPTTRDGFWIKRFLTEVRLFTVHYFFVRSTG